MIDIKSMYKVKKKRPVDPNAPPRPNLLSHEKVLKDNKVTMDQLQSENQNLNRRVRDLEAKMSNQSAYLSELHRYISQIKKG
jgi:predicted RNase H-like nuclease (RuvC/YqgF family)